MEAKELMHGDLFKYFGQLCRFVIYGRGAVVVRMSDDSEYLPIACNDAEPIPLTEKILELNGFKFDDDIDEFKYHRIYKCNKWYARAYKANGVWNIWVNLDCFNCSSTISKRISYVHELQHALRLCGLNELSDNFKIE